MQTKKKGLVKNVSKEPTSPRVSRSRKKLSENAQLAEKKVSDLITSSARRQRGGSLQNKNDTHVPAKGSNRGHPLVRDEIADICPNNDEVTDTILDNKCCEELASCVEQTIFSPTFHSTKLIEGNRTRRDQSQTDTLDDQHTAELVSVEEKKCLDHRPTSKDRIFTSNADMDEDMSPKTSDPSFRNMVFNSESDALDTDCDMEVDGMRLSSEVSAIYFAMKNSKLECVDEQVQETVAADVYVEDSEYDDFDPYFFIKNLPELSSVVPTFRPVLLPKQTRSCPSTSLVLDLDETLVHSTLEPCDDADFTFPVKFNLQEYTVHVRCRPHLRVFLERVAGLFEIIIFTASQSIYADQVLNVLDPKRKIFRHRVYRDSCVYVEGNYLKDLSVLGRDLARVIIIDNSPQAFGFQVDNGIPIESWFDDCTDEELLRLLPFLESLVGVDDVRPLIAKKYNLREKIAAAAYPPSNPKRRDPLER